MNITSTRQQRRFTSFLLTGTLILIPFQGIIAQEIAEDLPTIQNIAISTTTDEVILTEQPLHNTPTSKLLKGKSNKEKANIKSEKLSKIKIKEPFSSLDGSLIVNILEINKIDEGIEVYVKAWRNDEQVGFGPDGSVEIEKIKIINPPILIRDSDDLREDLEQALKESVLHTVEVIAKDGAHIQKGKVGRTTTTVYPNAGTGGTTVDGYARRNFSVGGGDTWSSMRNGMYGGLAGSSDTLQAYHSLIADITTNRWRVMQRAFFLFDTSSIPDTDAINSASLSLHTFSKVDGLSATESQKSLHIVSSNPASNGSLVKNDFPNVGGIDFGNVTYTSIGTTTYTDITLNSSGLANISKTGISKFATRSGADLEDDEPSWSSANSFYIEGYFADQSGTTNDPKLIINHGPEEFTLKIYAQTNDGYTSNSYCNEDDSWSSVRDYTGNFTFSSCSSQDIIKVRSDAEDGAYQIYRGSLVFDTSAIPDTATITAATINLYGSSSGGENNSSLVLTSHSRASTTSLVPDDWHLSDYGSISFGSSTNPLATSTYTSISLNSSGMSHINDTSLTTFGLLTADDYSNSDPGATRKEVTFASADTTGTSTDPYIEITYTN